LKSRVCENGGKGVPLEGTLGEKRNQNAGGTVELLGKMRKEGANREKATERKPESEGPTGEGCSDQAKKQ